MIPILLALAYTAKDQGEWGVAVGMAGLAVIEAAVYTFGPTPKVRPCPAAF